MVFGGDDSRVWDIVVKRRLNGQVIGVVDN